MIGSFHLLILLCIVLIADVMIYLNLDAFVFVDAVVDSLFKAGVTPGQKHPQSSFFVNVRFLYFRTFNKKSL